MCQDGENVPMGTLLLFSQVLASMEDDSRDLWVSAGKSGNISARNITTDVEIQPDIIKGLGKVGFFEPIKKTKIDTGLTKQKRKRKAVAVIQEDRQGFDGYYATIEILTMHSTSIQLPLSHSVWDRYYLYPTQFFSDRYF